MEIEDIEAGKSYACYFYRTELVDSAGSPIIELEQTPTDFVKRKSFGLIKTRDFNQKLLEVIDTDTGNSYTVGWEDCWGIDEVEWRDYD
jgi:hypothetical protein